MCVFCSFFIFGKENVVFVFSCFFLVFRCFLLLLLLLFVVVVEWFFYPIRIIIEKELTLAMFPLIFVG